MCPAKSTSPLRIFVLPLLVLVALVIPAGHIAVAGPAADFITDRGDRLLAIINDPKLSPAERTKRFYALSDEAFDVPRIARFVLGRYWQTASDAEREQFAPVFEAYMVQVYLSRFSHYRDVNFKVTSERTISDNSAVVRTQINRPGNAPPAEIEWRLAKSGNSYKIIDASVEGISQLLTYQQEFSAVIERHGGHVSALIDQLRQKASAAAQ